MKSFLFLILCSFPFLCCGDNNSNAITEPIPLADPFILYHDGTYYAYGTHSADGIEVYSSESLKEWTKHTELALNKKDSYGDKWFWAPEVYYNEANKKFYMYYSAEEHICVATSDSPLGPFVQDEKKPMREEKSIDSSLFVDEDGTPYLYFVRFTNGNVIWAAQLESDLMTIKEETLTSCIEVSEPWEMSMAKVAEGPSVVKRNGVYYLIYSANHYQSHDYGVGYATATSPLGEWKKSATNPIFQHPNPELVGVGHGAMFTDKAGKTKYVFHAHFSTTEIHPRLMHITDMAISDKGVTMSSENIITPYIIVE
ncbi:glycoside hydrolase family 43 protein [Dysgonomonas sp. 25]|uniref:glycoside hydrolase family 43 protein n=1 Tax=Dysgonomonas sp. 25 TaxID=2302933 RepID=UPI0013D675BE|nr:glycoside hydrolase family 43 protein [Dysgonomonas sp. 25]NDV70367.1 1,4-beta-xylanase [Dysgonomonas sp. 25]